MRTSRTNNHERKRFVGTKCDDASSEYHGIAGPEMTRYILSLKILQTQ